MFKSSTRVRTRVPWYSSTMVRTRVRTREPSRVRTVLREAMQALVRLGPHACEDCGGDPRCRHRCRVGTSTVEYRDVFYADNAHYGNSVPVASECLYFKSFLIEIYVLFYICTSMLTTPTSVPVAPECLYFKSFLR